MDTHGIDARPAPLADRLPARNTHYYQRGKGWFLPGYLAWLDGGTTLVST